MKKIGNVVSSFEIDSSSFGRIHRGYKFEKDQKERIIFYELPFTLKLPEENPQHISLLDILYKEQGKDFTLIGHPYLSGFPLSQILKKCEKESFPLPLDQSLLIIERITSAFDLFKSGFPHPFFIWLTYDGEVKCSPIPIPRVLQKLKAEGIQNYLSPQILQGDDWGRTDQVYASGVLFFELLTGKALPLAKNEDEVIQAVVKTHLAGEGQIPKDLQVILLKALSFKSSERFQHIKNLREELGKLIYSGAYSPTTFNLAFFMHSLFREEIDKEEKILKEEDLLDFKEILQPPKVETPVIKPPEKSALPEIIEPKKKKNPFIFIGLSLLAVILIIGSIFLFKSPKPQPVQTPVQQNQEDEKLKKELEEYKKKMEELEKQALKQKEELDKLQKEATKNPEAQKEIEKKKEEQKKTEEKLKEMEQKKKEMEQPKPQEVVQKKEEPSPQIPVEEQKKEEIPVEKEEKPVEVVKEEPKKEETLPKETKTPSVKEGDLVPLDQLDITPVIIKSVKPNYPPIAKMQKQAGKVTLKVLVNQNGDPEDIQVVSVSPSGKFGFEQSAVEAVKKYKFQPGLKEGVKVKCWFWVPVIFNP